MKGFSWDVYYWTVSVIIWTAILVAAVVRPDFFGPVPPLGIW